MSAVKAFTCVPIQSVSQWLAVASSWWNREAPGTVTEISARGTAPVVLSTTSNVRAANR